MPDNQDPFTPRPSLSQKEEDSAFYLTLLRAYINSANDGIFVICDEMKFHVANLLLESWLGETETTLTMQNQRVPITSFIGVEESQALFSQKFEEVIAGKPVRFECRIHPKNASQRWVEISMNKVDLDGGDLVIGVMRDITERKVAMAKMERQAIHDDLTGLINRREFGNRLNTLLEDSKRHGMQHSLLYMDLDQFKIVNDTCGHIAGDELLRQLSALINARVRQNDTLARLGGDEFGVLLTDCPVDHAIKIAEVLRQTISNFHFHWQGKRFEIGVSIGVTAIDANCENTTEVLGFADAACYVAKDKGRNRIQLYSGGEEFALKLRETNWVSRINLAIEEQRFRLFYQTILPIASPCSNVEHQEILLRMIDENGHLISPGEFIPAAEKFNLMPTIDRWVIRTLFARKSEYWRSALKTGSAGDIHSDLFCSVNLSGASLNDDHFFDFLREQIAAYDTPPHAICFEITETVAVHNLQKVSEFIRELRSMGFRFALDDFGSGMSSFTYLKSLPVDFLKIDGALVKEIGRSKIDLCMVEAIHRIAQEMGIKTIAEYVENDVILERLKTVGVNYAQGYGIHKPEALG
ncbi:MAG: EAL domain-containing protein [Gammaproteobacteria bacterium]|nr:EAL domain-containing protein [Gammaproteobacteria bacterium]